MMVKKEKSIERRVLIDKIAYIFFLSMCVLCAAVIVIIVAFIIARGVEPFFKKYNINNEYYQIEFKEFLFGTRWNFSPNHFGAGFIIINTIYITILTIIVAVPVSVLTALFIARIAPKK